MEHRSNETTPLRATQKKEINREEETKLNQFGPATMLPHKSKRTREGQPPPPLVCSAAVGANSARFYHSIMKSNAVKERTRRRQGINTSSSITQ